MTAPLCARCGCPSYRAGLCVDCMALLMACRAAVAALMREQYIEVIAEGAYRFLPGAKALADLLAETDPLLLEVGAIPATTRKAS